MSEDASIRRAITVARDPAQAAAELYRDLWQAKCCLVLLFVSPDYDTAELAEALAGSFGDVAVVGCTTSGEIGPGGYAEHAVVGVSLGGSDFAASVGRIDGISRMNTADMQAMVRRTRLAIYDSAPWARHNHLFALTLIDGMCGCEELVVNAIYGALAGIPLCGGSAGDGMRFERTFVLHDRGFHADCALVIVIATTRRFAAFKTEHFVAGVEKTVVTAADPQRRIVFEINAEPAAGEYARITGLEMGQLTPAAFATHPVVVRIGEQSFVRSIQRANADQSLSFLCAIDEGAVLTVAHGVDLVRNLEDAFARIEAQVGPPAVVIAFDCILRGLEMDDTQTRSLAGALIDRNNAVGFCTYGEQYEAMHVNQTLTGVAIGGRMDA